MTTGETMSDSMQLMAASLEFIATSLLERGNRGRAVSHYEEAIAIFKDMSTDRVPVGPRFRFIRLLATEPDAAAMIYGKDDEIRNYMVEQLSLASCEGS
ncbi:hypothetical protein ON010_g16822 [Phytophthora cinnamomi]|nr:hypothetical protein ON010_g16822 [Phytophthora cinnamomi]